MSGFRTEMKGLTPVLISDSGHGMTYDRGVRASVPDFDFESQLPVSLYRKAMVTFPASMVAGNPGGNAVVMEYNPSKWTAINVLGVAKSVDGGALPANFKVSVNLLDQSGTVVGTAMLNFSATGYGSRTAYAPAVSVYGAIFSTDVAQIQVDGSSGNLTASNMAITVIAQMLSSDGPPIPSEFPVNLG